VKVTKVNTLNRPADKTNRRAHLLRSLISDQSRTSFRHPARATKSRCSRLSRGSVFPCIRRRNATSAGRRFHNRPRLQRDHCTLDHPISLWWPRRVVDCARKTKAAQPRAIASAATRRWLSHHRFQAQQRLACPRCRVESNTTTPTALRIALFAYLDGEKPLQSPCRRRVWASATVCSAGHGSGKSARATRCRCASSSPSSPVVHTVGCVLPGGGGKMAAPRATAAS